MEESGEGLWIFRTEGRRIGGQVLGESCNKSVARRDPCAEQIRRECGYSHSIANLFLLSDDLR